jgi:hypothetical protein
MSARSSEVMALSAPTENAPMRPVNFAAPRMVVCPGAVEYPPSGTSTVPRGDRPMRLE